MQVFGMSDIGLKRQLNEDNFEIWQDDRMLIAVVCDGMGGAQAGEVASRMACISIQGSGCRAQNCRLCSSAGSMDWHSDH